MEFEWDEEKDKINQRKHSIPFKSAARLFKDSNAITKRSLNSGSDTERYTKTGLLDGQLVTAIFTYRDKSIRIISIRRARNEEKWEYSQLHNGRA